MHKKQPQTPLAMLMESRDISANQLSRETGIPQPTISRIASGETKEPKEANLMTLAGYFGVTTAHLRGTMGAAQVMEASAKYASTGGGLSPLAVDIARRWMSLSPDRQEWFRDLIFTMHFVEKRFPAMKKGRPKGESYTNLEMAFERDMKQLKLFSDP